MLDNKTGIKAENGEELTNRTLAAMCLKTIPPEGITTRDMVGRLAALEAVIDKGSTDTSYIPALASSIDQMRWPFMHPGILAFESQVKDALRKNGNGSSVPVDRTRKRTRA